MRSVPPFSLRSLPWPAALVAALAAVAVGTGAALAEDPPVPPEFASVDWPPPGERLRELTRRLDIEIGFAARRGWPTLPEAEIYRDIVSAEFGTLTPESSLKWSFLRPFENVFDFDDENDLDDLIEFAEANGMRVHGHPLTWYLLNPMWLETLPPERMEATLREHVETVVSRYAGIVDVWDVVNEGLDNEGTGFREEDPFYAALGPRYMDVAFAAARASDPGAELIYNDFDIGWLTPKSALALELVDDLIAREVPIDGVGMQMHLDHTFIHFEGFSEAMQRFVDRDLDVYVTELDVGVLSPEDYGVQADVYEEVIRRCLMQPRCRAVQIWGVDDKYSWRPFFRPLPFDEEFGVKPAYFGIRRALMTRPVHPERCALDGARVERGTVYADAAGADGAGSAPGAGFGVTCEEVPLGGGFTSLAVRYRNPGTDTPELAITAGGTSLATIALAPVPATNDGDYRTVTVEVPPLAGGETLTLRVGAVSDGSSVGIDALLFGDPTLPLPEIGGGDGGSTAATGTGGDGTDGGATAAEGSGGPGDDGAGGGLDGGAGGVTGGDVGGGGATAGAEEPSGSGGGGGASGPLWLLLASGLSALAARRRRRGGRAGPAGGPRPTVSAAPRQ